MFAAKIRHDHMTRANVTRKGINALAGSPAWPLDKSRNPAWPLDKSRNWNAKAEIFDWLAEISKLYYTVEQSNDRKSSRLAAAFVDTSEGDPATREHENVKTCREHLLQEARKCNRHKSRDEETTAVLWWTSRVCISLHMKCGMVRQCILLMTLATINENIWLGHIASLNPYSEMLPDGTRLFIDFPTYMEDSVFLGLHHFNVRAKLSCVAAFAWFVTRMLMIDIINTLLSPLVASQPFLSCQPDHHH
jgi:hypothetical protein